MARRAQSNIASHDQFHPDGKASVFTCPDCQGTLFLVEHGNAKRFRCRTGHMYSPESMLEAQGDNVERLMWSAIRALAEHTQYLNDLSQEVANVDGRMAQVYAGKSRAAEHSATIIRKLITRGTEDRTSKSGKAK